MLDGLKRKVAASGIMSVLKSLATNNDTKTTITGVIAGTIIAIPGLDMGKILSGDPVAIAHLVAGFLVGLICHWATRPGRDLHTTLAGAVAGSLNMMSGEVSDIVTGIVIAVLGYLTNKPVTAVAEK